MSHYTITGIRKTRPEIGAKAYITVTSVEGPYPDEDEIAEVVIRKRTAEELERE